MLLDGVQRARAGVEALQAERVVLNLQRDRIALGNPNDLFFVAVPDFPHLGGTEERLHLVSLDVIVGHRIQRHAHPDGAELVFKLVAAQVMAERHPAHIVPNPAIGATKIIPLHALDDDLFPVDLLALLNRGLCASIAFVLALFLVFSLVVLALGLRLFCGHLAQAGHIADSRDSAAREQHGEHVALDHAIEIIRLLTELKRALQNLRDGLPDHILVVVPAANLRLR